MIFHATAIEGVVLVEREPAIDERGAFARAFDAEEFAARGLIAGIAQSSVSSNRRAGTLRGLHLQMDPHAEHKLVRCTRGAIFDVVVDLREGSPTLGRWYSAELRHDNDLMLHVPPGCAHGFQTLADDSDVAYDISTRYEPTAAAGVAWNDPRLAIPWPEASPRIISERDAALPGLGVFLETLP